MAGIDKKAVVTAIEGAGSFSGDDGLVYKYEVEFDNGDTGTYFTPKSRDQIDLLIIGKEAEYTIEAKSGRGGDWNKITPRKPKPAPAAGGWKGGGGGGGYKKTKEELAQEDKQIARQSSVKIAMELITHKVYPVSSLLILAEIIAEWVVGERPPAKLEKELSWTPPKPKPAPAPQADPPPTREGDNGGWPRRDSGAVPPPSDVNFSSSSPIGEPEPEDDLPF